MHDVLGLFKNDSRGLTVAWRRVRVCGNEMLPMFDVQVLWKDGFLTVVSVRTREEAEACAFGVRLGIEDAIMVERSLKASRKGAVSAR